MSTVTVQEFATELSRPVTEILAQLKEAGVVVAGETAELSAADKQALLVYLQQKGRGAVTAPTSRISLKRKETTEIKLGGGRGAPTKTVSIEVRKRRTYLKADSQEAADEIAAEAEARVALELAEREAAAARTAAELEVRRVADEAVRLAREETERVQREAEEAELRDKQQHADRLKNDPIFKASWDAQQSRRRAEENIRRAAEMRNAPPPVVVPVVAKKPEKAAPAATTAAPDRNKGGHHNRGELHVAEGKSGKREKKSKKPTGRIKVDNVHGFEKPVAPIVREVEVPEAITVGELANRMAVKATDLIRVMMKNGVMATINQTLDQDTAVLMVEEMGHQAKAVKASDVEDSLTIAVAGDQSGATQVTRAPVVTIMGHVDHGKTSLLDYIRKTRVAAGEAGGITQHIGAYHVKTDKGVITFLDTPGHAAFTRMRARGAQITDIVVLVVAADDGVMPQTKEAIQHAKAAGAPIVVAMTKMDKPSVDPERVKMELSKLEVQPEDWGGDVQFVGVSSVTGQGIDALLDALLIQAEVLELKAAIDVPARGTIVESSLEKGRGAVATVLVRAGTLKQGDVILTGPHFGRVRAMFDETGKPVKEAGPSIPVAVLGLSGVPDAGDDVVVVADERKARELALLRETKMREQKLAQSQAVRMDQIFAQMGDGTSGEQKSLNLMIKTDVQGSAEALADALRKLPSAEVKVNVLSASIGGISESDVDLALASRAIIIGFNVRADSVARKRIQDTGVDMRYYSIIYNVIDDVTDAIAGLLGTETRENILGTAQVRDVFRSSILGNIAGCLVMEGRVQRGQPIRVLRNQTVIYEGELESLRRFKDDVNKVEAGTECGIGVKNYNDIKPGDQIECFERVQVRRTVGAA